MSKLTKKELIEIIKYQHGLLEEIEQHSNEWVRNYACYRAAVEKTVKKRSEIGKLCWREGKTRCWDMSRLKKVPEKIPPKKKAPKKDSATVARPESQKICP